MELYFNEVLAALSMTQIHSPAFGCKVFLGVVRIKEIF
jgi:hypothetical protein